MTDDQAAQTSSEPNAGFEGVACDTVNQRLLVITEKDPISIWSVDMTKSNKVFEPFLFPDTDMLYSLDF